MQNLVFKWFNRTERVTFYRQPKIVKHFFCLVYIFKSFIVSLTHSCDAQFIGLITVDLTSCHVVWRHVTWCDVMSRDVVCYPPGPRSLFLFCVLIISCLLLYKPSHDIYYFTLCWLDLKSFYTHRRLIVMSKNTFVIILVIFIDRTWTAAFLPSLLLVTSQYMAWWRNHIACGCDDVIIVRVMSPVSVVLSPRSRYKIVIDFVEKWYEYYVFDVISKIAFLGFLLLLQILLNL